MARLLLATLLIGGQVPAHAQTPSPGYGEAFQAMPGARVEDPVSRLGQTFWVDPDSRPFTPDFFETPDLERRVPVDRVLKFAVAAVEPAAKAAERGLLYRVRLETGGDAYIPIADFEAHLYVDLPPVSETRLKSDLYLSPEAYFFSIKSIFSENPDLLWERIRTLGPSRIRQPAPAVPPRSGSGQKPSRP